MSNSTSTMGPLAAGAHSLRYTGWLLGQVFVGALAISRDVIRRRTHMCPVVVEYPLRVDKDWQIFLLSTSVTMTPGTLSCGLRAADGDKPAMLIVQAVYGNDPAEVLAGVADMEQRLVPRIKNIDHGAPGQGSGNPVHSTFVAGHSDTHIGPTETDGHHERSAQEMPTTVTDSTVPGIPAPGEATGHSTHTDTEQKKATP